MSRDWRNERRDQGERAQAQRVELGQGYPANAGYAGGGGGGNGSYRSASVSAIKWNSSAPFHSTPPRFLQAYPCTVQFGWVVCIVIPRQGRGMMLRSERALQSIRSLFLHILPFLISQFTPPFPNPTTNDRHPAIAITTEVTAIAATATTEEKGATTAVAAEDITVAAAHELTAATRTTNNSIPAAVALAAAAVALAAAAADRAADKVGATIKTPEVAAAATPAAAVAVAAVMPEAAAAAAGTEMRVATKATTVAVAATEVQGGIQEAAAA